MSASACIVSVVRPALDVRTYHKEARSLAAAGWDVTVIGRDPGPPRVVDGIRILPLRTAHGAGRALAQVRALRLALGTRADVYHVADLELLPAALLLKRTRRPIVYDCIEDYPAYMHLKPWLPPRARPVAAAAVARLERFVTARLDAVLTADEGTAERLRAGSPRRSCSTTSRAGRTSRRPRRRRGGRSTSSTTGAFPPITSRRSSRSGGGSRDACPTSAAPSWASRIRRAPGRSSRRASPGTG
jgi:hypothetical protein